MMVFRLSSPSLRRTLWNVAAWLLAPTLFVSHLGELAADERRNDERVVSGSELAQVQPPAAPTTPPTPPTVTAPATPAAPATPTTPSPATAPAPPTNPNPQVGPNAIAQAQPNLAVRAPANNRSFSLARVPNMIGDLTGGGGAQIQTTGLFAQNLSHPSLTNGRLNIAENNSPLIGDRCYFTYRHFENASSLDYRNGVPGGGSASQNIDRVMFGIERQLTDTSSLEFRLPFNGQLDSNLLTSQFGNQPAVPYNTTNFELGNINLIFKQALIDTDDFYFSGGVGLNLPTAPDVKIRNRIVDPNYQVFDFSRTPPIFLGTTSVNLDQQIAVRNQTVNLSPYFSAVFRPSDRIFMQGFLQCDVPLNRSSVSVDEFFTTGISNPISQGSFRGNLQQQILLRANVGVGRWWRYRDNSRYFHSIATMFEVHYTTSLNDADNAGPFRLNSNLTPIFTQTTIGNVANRVDVVNLTAGVPMIVGRTTITNAVTVPIRGELNRSFDFEYSLLIDRRF